MAFVLRSKPGRRIAYAGAVLICLLGGLYASRNIIRNSWAQNVPPVPTSTAGQRHILVDQFGYRPQDTKVAVIRSPVEGYDQKDTYEPGKRFAVRREDGGEPLMSAELLPWDGGNMQKTSGDRGWWFDFSELRTPGRYVIVDLERNEQSAPFTIAADVYQKVLRDAVRMYFYQRSGFAKREPYAEICWNDDPAYLGENQDADAHDVSDRANDALVRDMRGGWFDAGDTNKYVTFAAPAVHQLLDAYEDYPGAFGDSFGIPESGNGIPDLIDEVRWETDWLKRMQFPHGGLALKVGAVKYTRGGAPSKDKERRYYVTECSSSTIAGAGVFAHAALVYRAFPALTEEATDLRQRALQAWGRFIHGPGLETHCDRGEVLAGNADLSKEDQRAMATQAAIYLYQLTGESEFRDFVIARYRQLQPYRDFGWGRYFEDQGHALLKFTTLPDAPSEVRNRVLADFRQEVNAGNGVFGFDPAADLYRSYLHGPQYHWGSVKPRANYGNVNLEALRSGLFNERKSSSFNLRALETLHYFHGVNPFGIVMLSNMRQSGATRSVDILFHTWFSSGTRWSNSAQDCGPAPGYVTGGANANVGRDGVPGWAVPPVGQPPQKAFRVSNDTRMAAWAFNEPGIYYQSAYVRLLAAFVQGSGNDAK